MVAGAGPDPDVCGCLSGDNAGAAGAVAAAVGMSPADVHADLMPEQKLALVSMEPEKELNTLAKFKKLVKKNN